jgi:hypothetical protein
VRLGAGGLAAFAIAREPKNTVPCSRNDAGRHLLRRVRLPELGALLALSDDAQVELIACQNLDQVLAGRVGQGIEQVTAGRRGGPGIVGRGGCGHRALGGSRHPHPRLSEQLKYISWPRRTAVTGRPS